MAVIRRVEPSDRLINLVSKTEGLKITTIKGKKTVVCLENGDIVYSITSNFIDFVSNSSDRPQYKKNVLKNKSKLSDTLDKGITYIPQDSFCDLLTEHLYLEAKEKLEELLPNIKKHFPKDHVYIYKRGINSIDIRVKFSDNDFETFTIISWDNDDLYVSTNVKFDSIWKNKYELIVKEYKPFPTIKNGYTILYETTSHIYTGEAYYIDGSYFRFVRDKNGYKSTYTLIRVNVNVNDISKIYNEDEVLIWTKEGENNENCGS